LPSEAKVLLELRCHIKQTQFGRIGQVTRMITLR